MLKKSQVNATCAAKNRNNTVTGRESRHVATKIQMNGDQIKAERGGKTLTYSNEKKTSLCSIFFRIRQTRWQAETHLRVCCGLFSDQNVAIRDFKFLLVTCSFNMCSEIQPRKN